MGDRFNNLIDNLIAVCWRLLEFPLFILLGGLILLFLLMWRLLKNLQIKSFGLASSRKLKAIMLASLFLIGLALIVDHKIVETLNRVRKARSDNLLYSRIKGEGELDNNIKHRRLQEIKDQIRRDSSWFGLIKQKAKAKGIDLEEALDVDAKYVYKLEVEKDDVERIIISSTQLPVLSKLKKLFGEVKIRKHRINTGIDFYIIKIENPLVHGFLAVIDLNTPNLEISITPEFREKYLISDFAIANRCLVAINGEAGQGPNQGSGFGPWVGNWIVKGTPILLKDNKYRPFIAFDRKNKARYYMESIVDTTLTEEKHNTIWGRFDIMIGGRNLNREPGFGQPRTIMGINEAGDKLYLFVIDGRQPGYSMGLGLKEAAHILKVFGASDAMACDQGGSSCIFVKALGGMVSQPADGTERFTYTHFGVSIN